MDPYIEKFNLLNLHDRVHNAKKDVNKSNSSDPGYGRITSKVSSHVPATSYSSYPNSNNSTNFVLANPAANNYNACGELSSVQDQKIATYQRPPGDYFEDGYRKIEPSRVGPALAARNINYLNNAGLPSGQVPSSSDYKLRQHSCPVYENLDYYNNRATPQSPPGHYHSIPAPSHTTSSVHSRSSSQDSKHSSPRTSVTGADNTFPYESSYRQAQPQVPVGVRFLPLSADAATKEYAFYESPPVYENINGITKSYVHEPAKPGPQVPIAGNEHKHIVVPPPEHLLTAVQHQVITSSPQRSNVAQASAATDSFVQQPYYSVSAFPKSSSSSVCGLNRGVRSNGSNTSQNTNNFRLSPEAAFSKSSSYSTSKQELDYNSKENFNSDDLSLSSNKLLPYSVTPPRPMVMIQLKKYQVVSCFPIFTYVLLFSP